LPEEVLVRKLSIGAFKISVLSPIILFIYVSIFFKSFILDFKLSFILIVSRLSITSFKLIPSGVDLSLINFCKEL